MYNAATGAVNNIEDDNFSGTISLLVIKEELLLLKQDGLYAIKIKNLLSKNYKTYSILKLNDAATMQFNIAKNNLLIADNSIGLLRFKTDNYFTSIDTFKLFRTNNSTFTKIIADRFNNFYAGTNDDGYFKINSTTKTINSYSTKNGLISNAVQCLFVDREDNLWIGTFGFGLQQLTNEMYSYQFIKDKDGIRQPINSIIKLHNKIAVATNKGIGFVNDDKINYITDNIVINKNFKNLIYYNNSFIFSTLEGELFKSDTLFKNIQKIKLFTTNQKLIINSLNTDKENIYACTSAGLYVINPIKFNYIILNTESGLMHNNVKFVFADSKNIYGFARKGR